MLKKLSIGIQTFSKIREDNYVYIDKTKEAYELISQYQYVFLSQPRRFGKSLFIDTLHNIFESKKEYFEGLYIYDRWDLSDKYPVIKISRAGDSRNQTGLFHSAFDNLNKNKEQLDIVCGTDKNPPTCLSELIRKVYKKYDKQVVILIDEYDKPILNVIDLSDQAYDNREFLKAFYSEIKNSDQYIRFTFLTGVSKFSKASIFSGLNMLDDISLNPEFGNICGYTQNDIETTFKPYLDEVDLLKLKEWYNGYNFLKDTVYNPFDILQFIRNNNTFDNYWFATGTPGFLIKCLESKSYFLPNISNLVAYKKLLDSFDIDNLDIEVILFHSGYLTIDETLQGGRGGIKYKRGCDK